MSDPRYWDCPVELTKKEKVICSKLKTTGKLFVFLREKRHLIFNDELNRALCAMYADHPKGKPPVPAAQLAMATLLQAYEQKSDAGATLEAMFDVRWRMVLNCLGDDDSAPFSQGTLCDFRHRLLKHNLDVALLERTVQITKELGGFGHQQLRVALDSAPLQGAGRVEDTFNLVGHALALLLDCAARLRMVSEEQVIEEAGTRLLGQSSIKAALDIDWSVPEEKHNAINTLLDDVAAMRQWFERQPPGMMEHQELQACLSLLENVLEQNIEPDPDGGARIKQAVAKDRQISVTDESMRHGRKSRSRTINGFKQHLAIDMDRKLVLATCVRPANEAEHAASAWLKLKVLNYGPVIELSIDRGYLASTWAKELHEQGQKIIAKPWDPGNNGQFNKKAFDIDLVAGQVTCPTGHSVAIRVGQVARAHFPASHCNQCPKQSQCTSSGQGRIPTLHPQEAMLQGLKPYVETTKGRTDARERVKVEHALASICNRKGPWARYLGLRLNEYDLNRTAMITNLHIALRLAA